MQSGFRLNSGLMEIHNKIFRKIQILKNSISFRIKHGVELRFFLSKVSYLDSLEAKDYYIVSYLDRLGAKDYL